MTNSGAAKPAAVQLAQSPIPIDDLLANGQGVGRAGDFVVFVTGALPGEEARIKVDSLKANYASAHATEIVKPSVDRVSPGCPVFPRCGGCQTLHLRYAAQLEWKRGLVKDALTRLGRLESIEIAPTKPSEFCGPMGYRNKVSLVPHVAKGRGEIGFYAARSHTVVPVDHCPVLLPWLDEALRALVLLLRKTPAILFDVRHIVVRSGLARKTLVMAFSTTTPQPGLSSFTAALRERIPALSGIVASFYPANDNAIFGRRFSTIWGSQETIEEVAGARFHFGFASFFQINTAMLEHIASHLLEKLSGARRVVDLYGGVGTFGVLLGKRGVSVTGVESMRHAVDEAAVNAALNGVTSAAFECASVSEAVCGQRGRTLLDGADAIILDPPRRGCEPEVLGAIAGSEVPQVEYLSCNPATLARDARSLVDAGYKVSSVQPFDMFPHTGHVEVLAEFIR